MQALVREMTANLGQTGELYAQILEVERRKQRAIVECEVDALPEIVAREEQLVALAADLAAQRLALRDRLADGDPRLGDRPTLREVVALLDGPERDALTQTHHHLQALAEQISEVNRTNFQLVRSSLDLLRGVIRDVFGEPDEPHTYDRSGQPTPATQDAARVNHVL